MIAQARRTFIAQSPLVSTPTPSPPPPPVLRASTFDFRAYGLMGAGGWVYSHQEPPMGPNTIPPTPILIARDFNPARPHPGSVTILSSHQLPYLPERGGTLVAQQTPFIPPAGSVFTAIGHIDSLPPNYVRPVYATTPAPPPHPGSAYTSRGGVPTLSTVPRPPPTLVARDANPAAPHPGAVFFRIGSGDLNPLAPGRPLVARESFIVPLPTLLPGAVYLAAQHTNTLIQTPPPVIARQSYVPVYPGSVFTAHAPIDNGNHRLTPLIAQESPRPFPTGSVFTIHGPPDNGLSVPRPILVRMQEEIFFQVLGGTGHILGVDGSAIIPPPTPPVPPTPGAAQECAFTADLTDVETFSYDFDC